MENSLEENFMRIKYEEQGKTCKNKILELPKNYESLMKLLKENFNFTTEKEDEENFYFIISYKDPEGDYLDISNSLDFDQALKCFENSKKNYLKIKISKKDRNAKESRVNNEFDFLNYDSFLNMRKQTDKTFNEFINNSKNSNCRSIAIQSSCLKKEFFGDQEISRIDASFQKLENKFSGEPSVNCNYNQNNNEKLKTVDKGSKMGEASKEMVDQNSNIENEKNDKNNNNESFKVNFISKTESLKFIDKSVLDDENNFNISDYKILIKNNEKMNLPERKGSLDEKFNYLPFPADKYKNIKLINANLNNDKDNGSLKVKDNIILNEQIISNQEDKNNDNNNNKLKNKKANENNENLIYKKKMIFRSNTHHLSFIDDNEKQEHNFNFINSTKGFENHQNSISANNLNKQNMSKINSKFKKEELENSEMKNQNNNLNNNKLIPTIRKTSNEAACISKSKSNKINLEEAELQKNTNKMKYFNIIKTTKKDEIFKNEFIKTNQNLKDIEVKPEACISSKKKDNIIKENNGLKKQNKKEKKNKQIENLDSSSDLNILIIEEKLKALNIKDHQLENLIYEKTKKGFEKLLINKVNKIIEKELKFTQEIIFRKSKSLIKEFLKDFESLIKKQLEINTKNSENLKASCFPITKKEQKSKIHFGTQCNNCAVNPIIGVRYACSVCPSFDLCEKCEADLSVEEEHMHNFIKIRTCEQAAKTIEKTFICDNKNNNYNQKASSEKKILESKNNKAEFNLNNKVKFYSNNNFDNSKKTNFDKETANKKTAFNNAHAQKRVSFPDIISEIEKAKTELNNIKSNKIAKADCININLNSEENISPAASSKYLKLRSILKDSKQNTNNFIEKDLQEKNLIKNFAGAEKAFYDNFAKSEFNEKEFKKMPEINFAVISSKGNQKDFCASNYSKSSKLVNQNSIDFVDKSFYNLFNSAIGNCVSNFISDEVENNSEVLNNRKINDVNFENQKTEKEIKLNFKINKSNEDFKNFVFPLKIKNTGEANFPNPCYLVCNSEFSDITGEAIPIRTPIKPGMIINCELKLNFKNSFESKKAFNYCNKEIFNSVWELQDSDKNFICKRILILFDFGSCVKNEEEEELKKQNRIGNNDKINEEKEEIGSLIIKEINYAKQLMADRHEANMQCHKKTTSGILSLEDFKKLKLKKMNKKEADENN